MIRTAIAVLFLASCGGASDSPGKTAAAPVGSQTAPGTSNVVSGDILAREPSTNVAEVKHILIGWKELTPHDARAEQRTKQDAENQVRALVEQLRGGADFDALMKQWSEDPGSAASARAYRVSPDAQLVIEFRQLGLRLKPAEIGVVESDFGFHIIKRVE